jgi:hypothetical protein
MKVKIKNVIFLWLQFSLFTQIFLIEHAPPPPILCFITKFEVFAFAS